MEVTLETDEDGFLPQECPACEMEFRVCCDSGSEEPVSFCPYCGHEGYDCWWTAAQLEHVEGVVAGSVVAPELAKLSQSFDRLNNGLIHIESSIDVPDVSASPLVEQRGELQTIFFSCCGEYAKTEGAGQYFCVICGKENPNMSNGAMRIFLSHKGTDKDLVRDYKTTLELLGLDPWLDEDAMPAGVELERALLQGMKESCAVVFFITPSFKDESFLRSEVNYAIQQKRERNERFSIIALQFKNEIGEAGVVPELLKGYVWKQPKTSLEGIREIIRALPITHAGLVWRDEEESRQKAPEARSLSTELSNEAKKILFEAVAGDGHVMHVRYMGGEEISANNKSLIPAEDRRTIVAWVGGLEDLQRRRLIRDIGHKGEVFEVTREGYRAADELKVPEVSTS